MEHRATIAIDASTLVRSMTGVGHYTASISNALASVDPDTRYLMLSNRPIEGPLAEGLSTSVSCFPTRVAWLQFGLPRQLQRQPVDLIHFTNYLATLATSLPYVLTLYDMTLKLFPRKHLVRRAIVHGALQPMVTRRAALIITLSENSKDDIVRLADISPDRIRVVPAAADRAFTPQLPAPSVDAIRRKYSLPSRYVLHVGTLEPRKNIPLLIEAFARARRNACLPHALVLAGARGWRMGAILEAARTHGDGWLRFLGYVDRADLPALYRGAELFVCATSYEGFGLPNLEAMASGTPVISTCVSSIPEVVGDAAILVQPDRIEPLADAIGALATDGEARKQLAEKGLRRASRFSWEESARLTRAVYADALGIHESTGRRGASCKREHAPLTAADWRYALARLAYHDLFDYPLTGRQLLFGLNGELTPEQIARFVDSQPLLQKHAERHGDFFALRGRGWIVSERRRRERLARETMRRNRKELERIGRMPFVRMAALSGATSYGNASGSDDIDLFLIVQAGRVWLTFLALVLRHKLLGKRRTFCPNFIIGDKNLTIREQDFYNAQQIAGLQPITGDGVFRRFVEANRWADAFITAAPPDVRLAPTTRRSRHALVERLFSGRLGDMAENCARRVGMWRMRKKASGSGPRAGASTASEMAVSIDRDYVKLHFIDHRESILRLFETRLAEVDLTMEDAKGRTRGL